jgi:hypothetical protein
MNVTAAGITTVVVTGVMFGLCANAHIDFFPCDITERDSSAGYAFGEGPIRTKDGTCSFMDHPRPERDGESDRLTGADWAMLVAFCGGIGVVTGLGAGKVLARKED